MTSAAPAWSRDGRDWPNRDASRFVEAGGLRWHVQVAGAGPVLLLLHGTGAATHSWRDLLPPLAARFTIVAPDLPGHGFTAPLPRPTLPAMARAVAGLTAALDLAPALVVGHSAGAAIAMRLALDAGGTLPVIAFNGALLPFPGLAAKLFPSLARLLFVNPLVPAIFAMQARNRTTVARFLARATGSTIKARGIDLYARLFARSGHVAGALGMMANWDLEALAADFAGWTAPLLLAYGDRDAAVPPSVAREVARRLTGAEARAMPRLGHLAHEEQPATAARLIVDAAVGWGILAAAGD